MILHDEGPYYVEEYDTLTEIFIDTILYSPNHDKIAAFIITRNSNDKLLSGGDSSKYHYNAHSFVGKRSSGEKNWDIKWFRRLNFVRHDTYDYISKKIRYRYFNSLAQIKGSDGKSQYKYNFDDIRFWDGPVWNEKTRNNPTVYETGDSN